MPTPLRPIFSAPPSAAGSSTSTRPHAFARSSISWRDVVRADLLVAREQQLDAVAVGERRDGVDGGDDPALHVEHARPGGPPSATVNGRTASVPSGNTVS